MAYTYNPSTPEAKARGSLLARLLHKNPVFRETGKELLFSDHPPDEFSSD